MPRCKTCDHLERKRVEKSLANGATLRAVARKFNLSEDSLQRHWSRHVTDDAKARYIIGPVADKKEKLAAAVLDENVSSLDHYRIIRATLYAAFDNAAEVGDRTAIDRLAGRLHENLRDCGRLTGELQPILVNQQNNINITNNRDYTQTIAVIIDALSRFPEARQAVISALRAHEARIAPAAPMIEHQPLAAE
jgi:hypothetical protein